MEGLEMNSGFWKSKNILLTGHTGFKGSWLSLWLQRLGANVIGYSLPPPTKPNLFEIAKVAEGMTSIMGDIRDLSSLMIAIEEHTPEIIIHMAAQSLVRYSYNNPVETYATNVMGTVNVLEASRHSESVKVILNVTSDKCYNNKEWLWGYREIEQLGGNDPYSSSKGCAELVTAAYRNSYFHIKNLSRRNVAVATARAGNVIGGGDWSKDRLIPDIMNAFMGNRPVVIRNPDATRPWQYVLDPLNGYLLLIEQLWNNGQEFADAWNFGPNDDNAKPVSWLADQLGNLWGEGARWKLVKEEHLKEANSLKLDSTKAKTQLGWTSKLSLPSALKWIVEWYRGYEQNKNMRYLSEVQIKRFESYEYTSF